MKLLTESELFSAEGIFKIREHYNASYILETCLRGKGDRWTELPFAVFYHRDETNVPEGGSRYFGLRFHREIYMPQSELLITNAISACEPFSAIIADNGDMIYSHNRHDYRTSPDGSVWIDGGRDYLRCRLLPQNRFLTIRIGDGKILEDMR